MNILYVTPYVPSRIRTRPYHLISALARLGHHVTLLTAGNASDEDQRCIREIQSWGVRVELYTVTRQKSLVNCLRALPTSEPLQAVYSYHSGMERRLAHLLAEESFDVVHIEHLRAARLGRAIKHAKVYDSVDCISLLFEQTMQVTPQLRSRLMAMLDLERTRRYEAWLQTQYNQVVVTSTRDKEALEQLARTHLPAAAPRAPITVVTNGVDLDYFHVNGQLREARTVIFTGKMSYHANVAGALYFAQQVLPRIWAKEPEVHFQIVGKDPPEIIQRLAAERRIHVTGTVTDIRPYLAQATLAVCPVPYAVGVQFKVLEAMAMGTPVVCTPAALAGLGTHEDHGLAVADGPEAFADRVLQIMSDRVLARRLAVAGRQYVETHHNWNVIAQKLAGVYEQAK